MSETSDIVRPSIEDIRALGIPCERIQSGWAKGLKGGRMKLADTGTPDIWTALCWIEAKRPGEKPTPEQLAWHAAAKRWGIPVEISESREQTIAIIKRRLQTHRFEERMGWL